MRIVIFWCYPAFMIPQTVDRIARTVQSSARSGAAVADIFRESMRHIVAQNRRSEAGRDSSFGTIRWAIG